ncbi:hypothetical protein Gorai_009736 [Gossypium raimondii]|uniref:DUF4283 domain-containing protein n=1 Tax=Gossypium raimondii TaxID=29730 RepID=A0A7J8PTZ6_GOSRA|nr:hypothetical protein [Gossypium raimondii]
MAPFTSVLANSRIGRATKKVQRWEEDPPNGNEMAVDMEGIEKATFKDKLLGPSNGDDDIDILEGDIRMDEYPSTVMVWIRLHGAMHKKSTLMAIGSVIGTVVKIDYNTENGTRGRFARMAISIDL